MEAQRLRKQDLITRLIEAGRLTPLKGHQMLQENYKAMTECEKTTDICRAQLELENHDGLTFAEKLFRGV